MYAVDEALIKAYHNGQCNMYRETFAAVSRIGTDDDVRRLSAQMYDDIFINVTTLITAGRIELARIICNEHTIDKSSDVLMCVYSNYGIDATIAWITSPLAHCLSPVVYHMALLERYDDISALVELYPDVEMFSSCIDNLPTAALITLMTTMKRIAPDGWRVGRRNDVSVCECYIEVMGDRFDLIEVIRSAIINGSANLVRWLMDREDVMRYIRSKSLGYVICGNRNEDVMMMIYDSLVYTNEDLRYAILNGQARLARKIANARKDCDLFQHHQVPCYSQLGTDFIVSLLSSSHPPRISMRVKVAHLRGISVDDALITTDALASIVAWKPMIALSGRWTVIGAYVDVDIITMCP